MIWREAIPTPWLSKSWHHRRESGLQGVQHVGQSIIVSGARLPDAAHAAAATLANMTGENRVLEHLDLRQRREKASTS